MNDTNDVLLESRPGGRRILRILLIEDSPADVHLALTELRRAGFKVREDVVSTLDEFLERVASKPFDIILADYNLPSWNGLEALQFLQEQGRDIPFILLTGMLGDERAVECIKQGASDFILKDRMARLPEAISRAIGDKQLRVERERMLASLRESEAKFRTLTDMIGSAVFVYQGTRCHYVNKAAEDITGYTQAELLAMSSWDLVHPDSREALVDHSLQRVAEGVPSIRFEIKILTKAGEARWLDLTMGMMEFAGQPAGLITAFDITERKSAEQNVREMALSDPLTGLANYRGLQDMFGKEAVRFQRARRNFSLLLLDVDTLKKINDAHGHLVGSRCLCRLALAIRRICRAADTPARYGGDEFALILPETEIDGARKLAHRIMRRLADDTEEPPITVSAGVAECPADGETLDELLETADHDLYEMKNHGGGRTAVAN
jgi:diguanylate cyclase (GGDEF)-like protein/PAS domain S-box-containing protein